MPVEPLETGGRGPWVNMWWAPDQLLEEMPQQGRNGQGGSPSKGGCDSMSFKEGRVLPGAAYLWALILFNLYPGEHLHGRVCGSFFRKNGSRTL